jgi:hypothetical protein
MAPFHSKSTHSIHNSVHHSDPETVGPPEIQLIDQEPKKYVVFSDAGSCVESMKTKYGKFNNPTSKNQKLMPGFRTIKNYAI